MSPGYQLPDDFFSPQSSPPRTGGYEVTEFPPREEYAVEIFDAPRKRVTSMAGRGSSSSSDKPYEAKGLHIYTRTHTTKGGDETVSQTFYIANGLGKGEFISHERAQKLVNALPKSEVHRHSVRSHYTPRSKRPYKERTYRWIDADGVKQVTTTRDPAEIEKFARGRSTARRATLIPKSEIADIVRAHDLPASITSSIIRDMDHVAIEEIDTYEKRHRAGYRGERGQKYSGFEPFVGDGPAQTRTQREVYEGVPARSKGRKKGGSGKSML